METIETTEPTTTFKAIAKSHVCLVRLTETEDKALTKAATENGKTKPGFIRHLLYESAAFTNAKSLIQ